MWQEASTIWQHCTKVKEGTQKPNPSIAKHFKWRQRLLGDEHPDVARSLNNLALLYKSQGRNTEAEPLYRQALEMFQRLLGDEHPDVAQSLNNLALLYQSQGRYTEAEPLYRQALGNEATPAGR